MSVDRCPTKLFCASLLVGAAVVILPALLWAQTPPEDFLGFRPGADFHLANYEQAIAYFELLASQTNRMQVFDMGPTSEGQRMKHAVISSAENMANLDRYKEINRRLSLVRDVSSEAEARQLAAGGKVVIWISGGLHASESSPAQANLQLAYDIATGSDSATQRIRDNVILLVVFANPDGLDLVSGWYMDNVGTEYESSGLPELYSKYAGHDNNRDTFISNLAETQNMNRLWHQEWFPEIIMDHHHAAPFPARIWIPQSGEPTNPNVHPLLVDSKTFIGAAIGKAFSEARKPGVIHHVAYDTWFPGMLDGAGNDAHNIIAMFTEIAGGGYANPRYYSVDDFPDEYKDLTMGVFYPNPWKGGWWRLADSVEYGLIASKAILATAASYRVEFLYNKWSMGKDTIERFKSAPPYGWIIPATQRDSGTAALMLERLMLAGVEVYDAAAPFVHEGISYPQGAYILPTSQPFGLWVKAILEEQRHPDMRNYPHLWQNLPRVVDYQGPPMRPYDDAGWTLPIQMGIDSRVMNEPLEIEMVRLTEIAKPSGELTGNGSQLVFSAAENNSFRAVNWILEAGGTVSRAVNPFALGETSYPPGTFIVERRSIAPDVLRKIAYEAGISMHGGTVDVASSPLAERRIAIYKSWVPSSDAGWSRFIFEHYAFPYHLLTDGEVKAGYLRERFDVIVLPDQGGDSIINGHDEGTMPPRYVGRMTVGSMANLKAFVEAGGTLICNRASCDPVVENFRLPVKNVLSDLTTNDFNCPGSILRIDYDSRHPVAYGLQERGIAFFSAGRVYRVANDARSSEDNGTPSVQTVASYPDEPLLISGWLIGGEHIRGESAILDASVGEGNVVLFGFNVQNRAQAFATFKLLFNAIYASTVLQLR